ncbi:MAG: acylphosphatase [Candidatus Syntrophoarchaeum caldarius]|uniref:acylphosphatase n=1 Tax=Candidatus Syntropharchaeum caldarium TaxID=1838285 RepID=A0A1F2P8K2_9EURY|nr:MAG: acylphosphatase [Candidatus Syntrophoarchaeum caldarius]
MNSIEQAHLIIKGRVQKAGYRDHIDEMAFNLDLTGYVKNLPDGSVEVVCEGEREKIEQFIDLIWIKQYPISVEDIEVDYSDATGEFRDFEIIREEDLTEAVYERMDTAARYMREMNRNLGEKIDKVAEKVDAGREENKQGFSMLGEKIDSIKDDTSAIRTSLSSLDDLKIKYEELSRDMAEIKQALKEKGIV